MLIRRLMRSNRGTIANPTVGRTHAIVRVLASNRP